MRGIKGPKMDHSESRLLKGRSGPHDGWRLIGGRCGPCMAGRLHGSVPVASIVAGAALFIGSVASMRGREVAMADWVLVSCLVSLRGEFNALAPGRDRTSDGSIGDEALNEVRTLRQVVETQGAQLNAQAEQLAEILRRLPAGE